MKKLLLSLNACNEAVEWADGKSWKEFFETCHRGDWLLWLFYKTMNRESETDFALLTIAKGHCANTVRHLMKDVRSTDAVDAAINYSGDRGSLKDAANAANAAYAAYAAYAAANAANADDAAYYAAATAAADAAPYAAPYAAAAGARKQNQLQTADIVRKCIPIEKWKIDTNLNWG